ncbi:stage III sporulation protein AA [Paenibacillus sp. GCM10023248]|uniref:stage III sporulation protein AA n=1 Tax=Bacillales TaxID=1385 RepID=UPI002378FEEA|nr:MULTISPECIES: stage III sporulation protein AA [Bacillales]MDD9267509.1 stage III sporulation protein AA [Paenibacillus sp. MAHUQ-63]MDR6882727.1 stage III sporulation protein AA [Bacillus sp. 3255]
MLNAVLHIFPHTLRVLLSALPQDVQAGVEEVRVRESRPLEISWGDGYAFVDDRGKPVTQEEMAYKPTKQDCHTLLEMLTNHSMYTHEEELRRGYITIAGGHRVGLAGRTVLDQGDVKQIRDVSSFNIRIAREVQGVGRQVLPHLFDPYRRSVHHTLVISPPQQGKTTLIRDLARLISRGEWGAGGLNTSGKKVGVVDERSELAACDKGVPRFDLGPRTDVMDGCPKAEGMMMMIRSLSPDVLIVDEIGRPEDAAAIHEAVHTGIRIVATAHGADYEDVRLRPVLKQLLEEGVFTRYVILHRRKGAPASFRILDRLGQPLELNPMTKG